METLIRSNNGVTQYRQVHVLTLVPPRGHNVKAKVTTDSHRHILCTEQQLFIKGTLSRGPAL